MSHDWKSLIYFLHFIKLCIFFASFKQFVMRSLLDDFSVLEYVNQISVLNRRKSVSDYDASSSISCFVECSLNNFLALGVER